jgi:hypothetical protein
MAVRFSALRAGRFLPPRRTLVVISVRRWVDPMYILRLEGLGKLKELNEIVRITTSDLPVCGIIFIIFFLFEYWGWSPNWVHSALRPLLAYCTCPGWLWGWRSWWNKRFWQGDRSTRRKSTPTPLCPPQIPLARPGREPGQPRWEASD